MPDFGNIHYSWSQRALTLSKLYLWPRLSVNNTAVSSQAQLLTIPIWVPMHGHKRLGGQLTMSVPGRRPGCLQREYFHNSEQVVRSFPKQKWQTLQRGVSAGYTHSFMPRECWAFDLISSHKMTKEWALVFPNGPPASSCYDDFILGESKISPLCTEFLRSLSLFKVHFCILSHSRNAAAFSTAPESWIPCSYWTNSWSWFVWGRACLIYPRSFVQ